jgi:WD40 repeat protein
VWLLHTDGALEIGAVAVAGPPEDPLVRWHPDGPRLPLGWVPSALAPIAAEHGVAHVVLSLPDGTVPDGDSAQLALWLAARRACRADRGAPVAASGSLLWKDGRYVVGPVEGWADKLDQLANTPCRTLHVPRAQRDHVLQLAASRAPGVEILGLASVHAAPARRRWPRWAPFGLALAGLGAVAWQTPPPRQPASVRPLAHEALALARHAGGAALVEDAATLEGAGVARLLPHPAPVLDVAIAGRGLLAVTADGDVFAWDRHTGDARWRTHADVPRLDHLAVSPDGSQVVVWADHGFHVADVVAPASVYDTANGALLFRAVPGTSATAAVWTDDGDLVVGTRDGQVRRFDTRRWTATILRQDRGVPSHLAWHDGLYEIRGGRVLTPAGDVEVAGPRALWPDPLVIAGDVLRLPHRTVPLDPPAHGLRPWGEGWATLHADAVRLWTANGDPAATLSGDHVTVVDALVGDDLRVALADGRVLEWRDPAALPRVLRPHRGHVYRLLTTDDGWMSAGRDGRVALHRPAWAAWRPSDGVAPARLSLAADLPGCSLDVRGRRLQGCGLDRAVTRGTKLLADVDAAWLVSPKGEVELWSPTEGSQHMPGGAFEPTSLARCPDGSVVLGSYGPEVRRWRPGDATVTVWEAHADDVADVACAEDRVVTGSWGGGVAVWTPEGKLRTRYAPLGADVRRVAVSDDGRHVAAATRDRRVRVDGKRARDRGRPARPSRGHLARRRRAARGGRRAGARVGHRRGRRVTHGVVDQRPPVRRRPSGPRDPLARRRHLGTGASMSVTRDDLVRWLETARRHHAANTTARPGAGPLALSPSAALAETPLPVAPDGLDPALRWLAARQAGADEPTCDDVSVARAVAIVRPIWPGCAQALARLSPSVVPAVRLAADTGTRARQRIARPGLTLSLRPLVDGGWFVEAEADEPTTVRLVFADHTGEPRPLPAGVGTFVEPAGSGWAVACP